jgi:RNA polymerase sigma-70 factor, ECF subfamily
LWEEADVETVRDRRFGADCKCESAAATSAEETWDHGPQEAHWRIQHIEIVRLYADLRPSLYAYLSTLGVVGSEAEEVVQEGFFRLVRDLSSGNEVKNPRGWLFRVAHNLAMDTYRNMSRDGVVDTGGELSAIREQVDPDPDPEEAYSQKEKRRRIFSAIQSLTSLQRISLLLRAEGRSYYDIGLTLGFSTQRAAFLVQRSLARLACLCEY